MNMHSVKQSGLDLPVIDIAALYSDRKEARQQVGAQIAAACETTGFFYITGYRLGASQIERCFEQSKRFFSQPPDFKNETSIDKSDRFQGYEPQTERESKEAYVLGPERSSDDPLVRQGIKYHGANLWPDLPGWRDVMLEQAGQMLDLARLLNRGLALSLDINEHYFDRLSSDPMYALRLLHYRPDAAPSIGIDKHTDWGSLSLLIQGDVPGLEIETRGGEWLSVPVIKDTIVVNIGEMVARWTGGNFKATPHRVVNRAGHDRYTIAFFLDMNHDAIIETLPCFSGRSATKYPPIRVEDFIDEMHKRDYGT